MSEWQNEEDFLADLNFVSDFGSDDNLNELELNHTAYMDDGEDDRNNVEDICDIKQQGHSEREVMDKVAIEVAKDLRKAGCMHEEDAPFFKQKSAQYSVESNSDASDTSVAKHDKPKLNNLRPSGFVRTVKQNYSPVVKADSFPVNK